MFEHYILHPDEFMVDNLLIALREERNKSVRNRKTSFKTKFMRLK